MNVECPLQYTTDPELKLFAILGDYTDKRVFAS